MSTQTNQARWDDQYQHEANLDAQWNGVFNQESDWDDAIDRLIDPQRQHTSWTFDELKLIDLIGTAR